MAWRLLTIALMFASAAPPPQVANALIDGAHGHERAQAGKSIQSRGRNRIGSEIQPAACRGVEGVDGFRPRPNRPAGPLIRVDARMAASPTLTRHRHSPREWVRLRC